MRRTITPACTTTHATLSTPGFTGSFRIQITIGFTEWSQRSPDQALTVLVSPRGFRRLPADWIHLG